MTKALFVIPNLTTGGIQTQVLLLAKYFQNQLKFDVTIWGIHTQNKEFTEILESEKIKYDFRNDIDFIFSDEYFLQTKKTQFNAWRELIKNLNKEKFDIVLPYGRISLVFNIIRPFTKIKLSFCFQRWGNSNPVKRKFNLYHWLAKISRPVYVANSYHGRKSFSIIENIPESKIHVIRNAFAPKSNIEITESWEYELENLLKSKIVVTMVSNFFDGKDHKTVIYAWKSIKKSKHTVLVFAGLGGPPSCQRNFEEAKKLVNSLNLQSKIFFLGSIKNINKLLDYTDIGLLSSKSEGCPNAILEYMGHELPVIGTDIPGIREILPEENQNFLFPVGNIDKCAKILNSLIENEELRISLGKINKKHVYSVFSPQKMYDAYKKILLKRNIIK